MPTKSPQTADTAKKARPAARKRTATPRPRAAGHRRRPDHSQIAERAYFIHLDEGSSDQVANWLRAERELMPA